MTTTWSDEAVGYLLRTDVCPRCGNALSAQVCDTCRADLGGPAAQKVIRVSRLAADALLTRQRLIDALPDAHVAPATVSAPPPPVAEPGRVTVARAVSMSNATISSVEVQSAGATSEVSLQSVLAVAGAGLFAIAAIVFAFLNPEVTFEVRTTVIAIVTLLFLGGAWLLRRRGVRFSAEALGALGMVFVALDIQAFVEAAPPGTSGWLFAALGTLVSSTIMLTLALTTRIRSWLFASLVGLVLVPAFLGYAGNDWASAWGHVGAFAVALAASAALPRARERVGSTLEADRIALVVLQFVALTFVVLQLPFLTASSTAQGVLGRAALLGALAVLAALSARVRLTTVWSVFSGVLAAGALVLAPFAIPRLDAEWVVALMPAAAAVAVIAFLLLPERMTRPSTPHLRGGALGVLVVAGVPAVLLVAWSVLRVVGEFASVAVGRAVPGTWSLLGASVFGGSAAEVRELAPVFGVAVVALVFALVATKAALLARTGSESANPMLPAAIAAWYAGAAAVGLVAWVGWSPLGGVLSGLVLAGLVAALLVVPASPVGTAHAAVRAPLILAAHAGLVVAALRSWTDGGITVVAGVVIAAMLLVVARMVPAPVRPVHLAVAYAYGLVMFATALGDAGLDPIPVLTLTTTLAAVVAIAATFVPGLSARSWQAVLAVTAVPFLVGVAGVVIERSGWTALSTGVIFLLAVALVVSRRDGLTALVRTIAAALLVPSLAVVVVCLAATLPSSGSPVALPIIATIVAVAVPSTRWLASELERFGLGAADGRLVRLAVEASALLTGAIAVLLALTRVASGLDTAMVVLIILGLGAAATSVFAERRYGWPLAGASWTGALWCALALLGVDIVEPYTLPPAIGAAVVGAIAVARGRRGVGLFTSGLGAAVLPSLVLLAVAEGDLVGDGGMWRVIGLLAASALLIGFGAALLSAVARGSKGLAALQLPLLAWGAIAAAAAAVQSVRWGTGLDALDVSPIMGAVLGLSLLGAGLAALAGLVLEIGAADAPEPTRAQRAIAGSRWVLAPAFVVLVVGPVTAIRGDWVSIWTLWGLMAALLVAAMVTVVAERRRATPMPPFWFLYALAWITGVVGWSERELRVEVFSLPLGVSVLAVGVFAMATASTARAIAPTLANWPHGFTGSWPLLGPGMVLTLLPSVLATGTDPQLYRPIMVIVFALAAILVGSTRKLAAPFILGLAVLPIENIVVFAAQIERTVGATPWWITLATAGALLFALAAGSERRTTQGKGVAARFRELQ